MVMEQIEYDDFTCIKNFVLHSDIEDDESGEDKKLTSLVRESYVKRLRQLLKQNYKVWCENYKDETESGEGKRLSSTEIDRCIMFLEDKALQVCMVARIYQKVMVKMMSDIKKMTKEMKLFDSLMNTQGWNVDRYPDKSTQTDEAPLCDKENQTDPIAFGPRYSLLDLPLPSSKNMTSCLEVKNTATPDSPCKQLKETIAKVIPRVISRPLDGRTTQTSGSRKRRRSSANVDEKGEERKSLKRDSFDSSSVINVSSSEVSGNLFNETDKSMISDTSLVNNSEIADNSLRTTNKSMISDTSLVTTSQITDDSLMNRTAENDDINEKLLSLDARLMEMGLLNVEEPSPVPDEEQEEEEVAPSPTPSPAPSPCQPPTPRSKHKGTWYMEMVAHVCHFHRVYSQLTAEQQARVDVRIVELFGPRSNDRSVKLSEDNLSVCQKRIASMVVAELTPYLQRKLIASRGLFKMLAKRVTESIMEESYAPDSSKVKQFVLDFFERNKSVRSMIDIECC
ncbi:uncharacterized protein LOC111043820 [Nilaparvata lugens]|uniref:uncharacterized protein LOC111043820 n=1 Tax=Nilaparvata lugens TaxID=108931 RepID=UPI00193D58F4|nr:uncharacterized protein LOC111043820 [Nilaparvata lugens]